MASSEDWGLFQTNNLYSSFSIRAGEDSLIHSILISDKCYIKVP